MLKWIKGSKSEHPFADEKSAREFIAQLPPLDPYKSLEELCYWLDTLEVAADLKLPRILEVIDLIDQAAKNHPRKLAQDYLNGSARLQKIQEIRIWNAVFSFWKHLADAYQMCLTRFQAGASGWGALKGQMPMVVARALRALALQLKWQLLRYGPVDQRVWEEMGRLYAYAEERGYANAPVVVYPGKFSESTVQREFLKGVMLNISSTDSLLPGKLEIAERIVAQFSEFFVMSRQPARGCHYYFDLNQGKAPARVISRLQMMPGLRFFGPGSAARELERLLATVKADGAVPSSINLGGAFDAEVVLEVLRHLSRYWAPIPPARSEERRNSVSRMSVVHDYDEIVSTVSGETHDLSFDSAVEVWTVENESDGGYGALMPQATSDWLHVGVLLGVKLDDGASWGVGIVRRLSAYDHKQRYVGIQVLTKGASVVRLAPISASAATETESALLLPSHSNAASGAGEMNLLLRPGAFSLHKSMEMRAYERTYLLVPRRLVEDGRDFDMARFRVMQRTA
ncbi:MAG TPA: hypothetical protein VKD04_14285 [Burkholderiales bacterium]|nr:hypothetical protein [Burkholderiales bacterium]